MFKKIRDVSPKLDTNSEAAPAVADSQPANGATPSNEPPPLRFGAMPILLQKSQDVIKIIEIPRENNVMDYDIYVGGVIDSSPQFLADVVTLLHTVSDDCNITMYISSPGGSLRGGARLAAAVKESKAKVKAIAIGLCGSAAALVWSYADEFVMSEGSVLLFHMSSHMDWGQSKYVEIQARNTVTYVEAVAIKPLVAWGILTADEVETILDKKRDVYIDSYTFESRIQKTIASRLEDLREPKDA